MAGAKGAKRPLAAGSRATKARRRSAHVMKPEYLACAGKEAAGVDGLSDAMTMTAENISGSKEGVHADIG